MKTYRVFLFRMALLSAAGVFFAGCAGAPPALDVVRSFSLLDSQATLYMLVPAAGNRELIASMAENAGFAGDISPVINRTERIYLSAADSGTGLHRFCVLLEGSYPQRIVRSRLAKSGWQLHETAGGTFYSAGQLFVALPQPGVIVIFSGYTAADMKYFLSGQPAANGVIYASGGTALPDYLESRRQRNSVVLWIPRPQQLLQKLSGIDSITFPAESAAALFEPSGAEDNAYNGTFFIRPKQQRMENALYTMLKYTAANFPVTLQDGLVLIPVENAAVEKLLQNFMGE